MFGHDQLGRSLQLGPRYHVPVFHPLGRTGHARRDSADVFAFFDHGWRLDEAPGAASRSDLGNIPIVIAY